jgi:hypothetical protein
MELSAIRKRRGVDAERAVREIQGLLEQIDRGELRHADLKTRDEVLYWAARLHAGSRGNLAEAKMCRDRLRRSGSNVNTRIVDALIREAEGDGESAVRMLSNADDSDARSGLFSILGRVRGEGSALGGLTMNLSEITQPSLQVLAGATLPCAWLRRVDGKKRPDDWGRSTNCT